MPGESSRALLGRARYLTPGKPSADGRVVVRESDGRAEEFYRDRWRHDREVRSTHGVSCTGSCSWMVYVRDGIVSWETQATDYPETSPDMPVGSRRVPDRRSGTAGQPRGCPCPFSRPSTSKVYFSAGPPFIPGIAARGRRSLSGPDGAVMRVRRR